MNADQEVLEKIHSTVLVLAEKHTDHVWTGDTIRPLERAPLMADLRRAISGDMGRSVSGSSSNPQTRSVLDLGAFTLYEDISGRIEAFHKALTGSRPRETPEATLRAWYVAYRAFFMSGKYTAVQTVRVRNQLGTFVHRIQTYLDPPRVKELSGACPIDGCGMEHYKSPAGATQTALYASYKTGEEPFAKCRACGSEWVGTGPLVVLGRHIGATLDESALREMGVKA